MAHILGCFVRNICLGCILVLQLQMATAKSEIFLGRHDKHITPILNMIDELERVTTQNHRLVTERRAGRLEEALRPMFAALPKNVDGTIGAPGVRYLLHRLFIQKHAWSVNGLDNGGDAWNSSSPSDVFKLHAEEHHDLFENKLRDHGFSLTQVAVFGAALESLVHADSRERINAAYDVLGLSRSQVDFTDEQTLAVMRAYMVIYSFAWDHNDMDRQDYDALEESIIEYYPAFPDTMTFVNEVRDHILEDTPASERNSVDTTLKVLEEVVERYGRWQDKECRALKKTLVSLEAPGTGRVHLHDFYTSALNNISWQFKESVPYLQSVGALDHSDPQQMSVIIPNYLNSPAQCNGGSKFFQVCCIDECESLLATLETHIAAPESTAALILEHVASLPSDTVEAPRQLPNTLVERLKEIEAYHGGRVPLHGRLFAQWMHHAYPRECKFPYTSGTITPLTPEEWMKVKEDVPIEMTMDEMREFINQPKINQPNYIAQVSEDLPWLLEEELFIHQPHMQEHRSKSSIGRALMLFATVLAFLMLILRAQSKLSGKKNGADEKHYV